MSNHLNDDQLLERLYGAEAYPHVDSCEQCSGRYRELESRRAELAAPVPVSAEFLANQRRRIVTRLDERPSMRLKWIPALAAASAVAIGLWIYRPVAAPVAHVDANDEQLFADVYSMAQSTEPRAASPIHSLFEDNQ